MTQSAIAESATASNSRSRTNSTRTTVADRRFVLFWLAALVFYAGTLLSFWAAYDRSAAFGRLAALTAGLVATAVIALLARRGHHALIAWMGLGCLALAVLIGSYFLLIYDWQAAGAGKVAIIYRLGLWLQAVRPTIPLPFSDDINGNVAGGALVLLLPLGLGGAGWLMQNRSASRVVRPLGGVAVTAAAIFVLAAIMMTLSRGSWFAVAASLVAATYVAWRGRMEKDRLWLDVIFFAAIAAFLIGIFALAVLWPGSSAGVSGVDALLGSATGVGGSGAGRVSLWRDMLPLVADYPFTGGGLGSTMMVFSSYILMLHVGFIGHAHHLFLQIAVEQGLPAMVAFSVMTGTAAWGVLRSAAQPGRRRDFPASAAIAAIVAMLIHGTVDAGTWTSKLAPVVFLPLGFALATWALPVSDGFNLPRSSGRTAWAASALALAALFIVALLPSTRSAVQSNLGAVAQTRAELGLYAWPEWPIQDAVRRSGQIDLTPAMRHYEAALSLNPTNAAASRRLGQIELSLGQYEAATKHIQAAFDVTPDRRPERQLLGEIRAINGSPQGAAELWRTISLTHQQLALRHWWYNEIGEPEKAALVAQGAQLAGQ